MSYRRFALLASLALAVAVPLYAQDERTIDPGMTREQVVEHLGRPLNERKTGNAWFMFYGNGCERTCGINDLVILEDGKVVDAIFRSPSRHYSAASSSPMGVRPERTAPDDGGTSAINTVRKAGRGGLVIASPTDAPASGAARATVTGVEVSGPPTQPAGASSSAGNATTFGGGAGGNSPQVTPAGGNAPQVGSPESAAQRATVARPVMPVPLPGAKINPADSVRALTPDRPTAIPGAKVNPADSVRAEAIRKQLSDTTRKPD